MSRQIVFSNLPDEEKDRFYDFLIANEVDFVSREDGFAATIRVVKPQGAVRGGPKRPGASPVASLRPGVSPPPTKREEKRPTGVPLRSVTPLMSRLAADGVLDHTGAGAALGLQKSVVKLSGISDKVVDLTPRPEPSEDEPGGLQMQALEGMQLTGAGFKRGGPAKSAANKNAEDDPGFKRSGGGTAALSPGMVLDKSMLITMRVEGPKGKPKSLVTSVPEIKRKYYRFCIVTGKPHGELKPMRQTQARQIVEDIYNARFGLQLAYEQAVNMDGTEAEGDASAAAGEKALQRFPIHLFQFLQHSYGLPHVTARAAWGMISTVEMLHSADVEFDTFSKFMDETYSSDTDLVFFLNGKHAVEQIMMQCKVVPKIVKSTGQKLYYLNAKQCIAVVRAITKDESYAILQEDILERLNDIMLQMQTLEKPDVELTHHKLLAVVTERYNALRVLQEKTARIAEEEAQRIENAEAQPLTLMQEEVEGGVSEDDAGEQEEEKAQPEYKKGEKKKEPKKEEPTKQRPPLDASMKEQVRRKAERLLYDLRQIGHEVNETDVLDFSVRTALRKLDGKSTPMSPVARRDDGLKAYSSLSEFKEASHVLKREVMLKKTLTDPLPHAAERDRIFCGSVEDFELNLEANVREFLAAAVEDMCSVVVKEGTAKHLLYDEPAILDQMVLEFAPVADRMMEAVVTQDSNAWLEELGILFPGSDKQQDTFADLNARFKRSLSERTVDAHSVNNLCKAVCSVPELNEKIVKRGWELVEEQEALGMSGQYGRADDVPFTPPRRGGGDTSHRFSFGQPENEEDSATDVITVTEQGDGTEVADGASQR
eukprot:TRINITY_DN47065_c0_g1_i1.p1 TRINITY_DN47065_c0_g1~~TRINITY_DN47065_c0_g1_i1.p1  ORF type:complete len:825 (-),score=259.73 TRINITY_DN47065_c0_g1_i1:224-2698(-)